MWEMYAATEVAKMRTKHAERLAAEEWCYRETRSREHKGLNTVLTSVLRLFSR